MTWEVRGGAVSFLKLFAQVMAMISDELSEPYSIFTYRYFVSNWPELCLYVTKGATVTAVSKSKAHLNSLLSQAVFCRVERCRNTSKLARNGYVAMLVVNSRYRRFGIATRLISHSINRMFALGCNTVTLESEVCNKIALTLYGKLGFVRDSRLSTYYMSGTDAYKLSLRLTKTIRNEELVLSQSIVQKIGTA